MDDRILRPLVWGTVATLGLLFVLVLWLGRSAPDAAGHLPAPQSDPENIAEPGAKQPPPGTYATAPRSHFKGEDESNGVTFFRRAHHLMEEMTERQQEILRKRGDPPTEDEISELLHLLDPLVDLVREGAMAERRQWALLRETGPTHEMNVPVEVARAVTWTAGIVGEDGDLPEAIKRLELNLALQDSLYSDGMIGTLIASTIDAVWHKGLAELTAEQLIPETTELQNLLATKTSGDLLSDAVRSEANFIRRFDFFEHARKIGTEPLELAKNFDPSATKETMEAVFRERQRRLSSFMESAVEHISSIEAYTKWAQSQQIEENSIESQIAVSMRAILERHQISETEKAILAGGIALQNGAAFDTLPVDPSTRKPFTRAESDAGFRLTSSLTKREKPISYTFALPAPAARD